MAKSIMDAAQEAVQNAGRGTSLLAGLLLLCASAKAVETAPMPKVIVVSQSVLKGAQKQLAGIRVAAVALPMTGFKLSWSYPYELPAPGLVFEVYKSNNLTHWFLISTVNQPPFQVNNDGERAAFFRVIAVRNGISNVQ